MERLRQENDGMRFSVGINRNILEGITQQNGLEINFWKEHIHIMKNVIPSSLFGREYGTDCI